MHILKKIVVLVRTIVHPKEGIQHRNLCQIRSVLEVTVKRT